VKRQAQAGCSESGYCVGHVPGAFVLEHLVMFASQLFPYVLDVSLATINFRHFPLFYWNPTSRLRPTSYIQR